MSGFNRNTLPQAGKWLALTALAASLMACQEKKAVPQATVLPVKAIQVQPETVPLDFEYMGQTTGFREVQIRARVEGILLSRNYTEGKPVKKGDLLFTIDPTQYKAAYDKARGALAQQEAALLKAKRNYDRIEPLYKENAVSSKDRDNALGDFEAAKASVQSAKASLEEASINLGYTRIHAPISGLSRLSQQPEGSLVSPTGDSGLLTSLTQLNPIYVNFSLSDTQKLHLDDGLKSGQIVLPKDNGYTVQVKLSDGTIYDKLGKVDFSDNIVNSQTGTIGYRAIFDNPTATLLPGQFVRVELTGAKRLNALVVPQKAVLTSQEGKLVWVIGKDNKVSPRPVEVLDNSGNGFVIGKGLKAGDRVIVDDLLKMRPGAEVKPQIISLQEAEKSAPAISGN